MGKFRRLLDCCHGFVEDMLHDVVCQCMERVAGTFHHEWSCCSCCCFVVVVLGKGSNDSFGMIGGRGNDMGCFVGMTFQSQYTTTFR